MLDLPFYGDGVESLDDAVHRPDWLDAVLEPYLILDHRRNGEETSSRMASCAETRPTITRPSDSSNSGYLSLAKSKVKPQPVVEKVLRSVSSK